MSPSPAHPSAALSGSPDGGDRVGEIRADQPRHLLWDIFCQVIDNYGDIGVCWRLSAQLAARGHRVRLWLDDTKPLEWMAPGAVAGQWAGISVHGWPDDRTPLQELAQPTADVWVEAFGCDIPGAWLAQQIPTADAHHRRPVWINLEYLSAESYALRSHGLPSPLTHGPAQGWTKYFFYPGFSPASGGLLREVTPSSAHHGFDGDLAPFAPQVADARKVLLFCYDRAPIDQLMQALIGPGAPVQLLVTAGQSAHALRRWLVETGQELKNDDLKSVSPIVQIGALSICFLPHLTQTAFDRLLGLCDLNLVRGEDSLVQATHAGKPFVWNIYPQEDGAHVPKLHAFLDAVAADDEIRAWHGVWNGLETDAFQAQGLKLPWEKASTWPQKALQQAKKFREQSDLCTRLLSFIQEKQAIG